jgi:hypothetical protein
VLSPHCAWLHHYPTRRCRRLRRIASPLRLDADATTVKLRNGQLIVSDGPYAETKEQVAGFDVLECADLDEAIEVASRHPMARLGILEVRPFRSLGEEEPVAS